MSADVAILYRIVTTAGQNPDVNTLPFRAIVGAYDEILAQEGINPDHDQVYLRFLFRLGDKKRSGSSLFERFQALLEELGIRIEITGNGVESQDATQDFAEEGQSEARNGHFPNVRAKNSVRGRSRRASFTSLYDSREASRGEEYSRPHSRASMSRLQNKEPTQGPRRSSTRATTRATEKTSVQSVHRGYKSAQPSRSRLTAQDFANNLQNYQRRHASKHRYGLDFNAAIDGAYDYSQQAEILLHPMPSAGRELYKGGDSHTSTSLRVINERAIFHQSFDTQLIRDVGTLRYYRSRQVARALFERWCGSAYRVSKEHRSMEQLALSHDTGALLRNGFDQWRSLCYQKRLTVEIEHYFHNQERRASKSRDLYLLTKAFTHWVQCSSESKIEIRKVREQLLESKYFNAWLGITKANSAIIRRQRVSKYFRVWRQRVAQASAYDARATLLYNHKVARNAYWCWFWAFCKTRAPIWRDNRIRKRFFSIWKNGQQKLVLWEQHTLDERRYSIAQRHFSIWLFKVRAFRESSHKAALFSQTKVFTRVMLAWRRRARHAPLERQVSNLVDWRVAGTTFAFVIIQYRFQRQAYVVSQSRIARNAWTLWNDRLRQQTLIRRVDDRIIVESLYRWVIGERQILLARLHEKRIERRAFSTFVQLWAARIEHRHDAAQIVTVAADRRRMISAMKHWRSRTDFYISNEKIVSKFYAPRIYQAALQSWTAKNTNVRELRTWATVAEFYFLATKFVKKRWRSAMIDSKRRKRRDAYAQLRRMTKMHLAARILVQWRHRTASTSQSIGRAYTHDKERLLQLGSQLFDSWRIQASSRATRSNMASQYDDENLVARFLARWISRLENQWRMADFANLNENMRIHSIATQWLHKLRLRVIEVTRGPEANAHFLNEFHEKRRVHNIFRRWQGKSAARVRRPVRESVMSSNARRPGLPYPVNIPASSRGYLAERSVSDGGFDTPDWLPATEKQPIVTPLHGYYNTPSKRAERVKAIREASTTPTVTPIPFGIRTQTTEPRSIRRTGLARSTNLRENAFATIPEGLPRTPQRL